MDCTKWIDKTPFEGFVSSQTFKAKDGNTYNKLHLSKNYDLYLGLQDQDTNTIASTNIKKYTIYAGDWTDAMLLDGILDYIREFCGNYNIDTDTGRSYNIFCKEMYDNYIEADMRIENTYQNQIYIYTEKYTVMILHFEDTENNICSILPWTIPFPFFHCEDVGDGMYFPNYYFDRKNSYQCLTAFYRTDLVKSIWMNPNFCKQKEDNHLIQYNINFDLNDYCYGIYTEYGALIMILAIFSNYFCFLAEAQYHYPYLKNGQWDGKTIYLYTADLPNVITGVGDTLSIFFGDTIVCEDFRIYQAIAKSIDRLYYSIYTPVLNIGSKCNFKPRYLLDEWQDGYFYRITEGSLPNGLSIDPVTGVISGIPDTISENSFTVECVYNELINSTTVTLTIVDEKFYADTYYFTGTRANISALSTYKYYGWVDYECNCTVYELNKQYGYFTLLNLIDNQYDVNFKIFYNQKNTERTINFKVIRLFNYKNNYTFPMGSQLSIIPYKYNNTTLTYEGDIPGVSFNNGEFSGVPTTLGEYNIKVTGEGLSQSFSVAIVPPEIEDIYVNIPVNIPCFSKILLFNKNKTINIPLCNITCDTHQTSTVTCTSIPDDLSITNDTLTGILTKDSYTVTFIISNGEDQKEFRLFIKTF